MSGNNSQFYLPVDALVRSIGVSKGVSFTFFLGAGASMTSGVPSAEMCVWEWKRNIFLTNNPGLEDQFAELTLSSVRGRIQKWLDDEGTFPCLGSPDEYGFYAEYCFPIPQDRRQYFEKLAKKAHPHLGYQLLCLQAKAGYVDTVWTTNFDGLIAKAGALLGLPVIEIGLDCTSRIKRQRKTGELQCVALHGDYRYDFLKNTDTELQSQDETLRQYLIDDLTNSNLIVVGYSGKDESIMNTLEEAYSQNGVGRLYWCEFGDAEPSEKVANLLQKAKTNQREAFYTPISGFDDLLIRLGLHCLTGHELDQLRDLRTKAFSDATKSPKFDVDTTRTTNVISSNAFSIECPSEVYQFKTNFSDQPGAWSRTRECTNGQMISAAPLKGNLIALGTIDSLKKVFANQIIGEITRSPILSMELADDDSVVLQVLTQALTQAISKACELDCDNRSVIWKKVHTTQRNIKNIPCKVHDAAYLHFRRYNGQQYLVVHPTIIGLTDNGDMLPIEINKELKRSILTYQYNQKFFDSVKEWKKIIFHGNDKDGMVTFEYPESCASAFSFKVLSVPALARIADPKQKPLMTLRPSIEQYTHFGGVNYPEPSLVFSNLHGDGYVTDVHPLRGITVNQPYDFSLTKQGLCNDLRVGVICPSKDTRQLYAFLDKLHKQKSVDSKEEYLLDFQGFEHVFGLPLVIPQPQNNAWVSCPEPSANLDAKKCANELGRNIIKCIDTLNLSVKPNVIIIYIPSRWQAYKHYIDESIIFDLHNFIKAYCVHAGVTTQFLEEHTLYKPYSCEIMWWFSCSLYVKSMRTPWVLDSLNPDTAFAGIGYSLDTSAQTGNHVVLGCSHIYNTAGMGLKYKLSKIDNPIIRRRNPYLPKDDARRVGESILQLCYESLMRFPERVVIHKLIPFMREEKEGLLAGLSGIKNIDMIQINYEPWLRYTTSNISSSGKLHGDAFPIKRGTALVLDDNRGLLWVHGTTKLEVNRGKPNYYMGKSRIPAPLVITRHYGTSSFATIVNEVLGLSKMDWNSFDMYTKLPATIKSSNAIARIGSLLDRFGSLSYDYRLFI